MNLKDELALIGYYKRTAEDFRECLADMFAGMFPHSSVDEILCDPADSSCYCEHAKRILKCKDLPDKVILRTIQNMQKRGGLNLAGRLKTNIVYKDGGPVYAL